MGKCDGKGPTITLARDAKTKRIIGGFSDVSWESLAENGAHVRSDKAFVFVFVDEQVSEGATRRRHKCATTYFEDEALYHSADEGPSWSCGLALHDADEPENPHYVYNDGEYYASLPDGTNLLGGNG